MTSYLYQTGARGGADSSALTAGESTYSRLIANTSMTMSSGGLRLTFFTAQRSEPVTSLRVLTSTTAAAATPTLIRMVVYSVAENGNLTSVATTANDLTLLAVASTAYTKALEATWQKAAGARYAIGLLVITAAAAPTVSGITPVINSEAAQAPRIAGSLGGQSDVPASITAGTVQASNASPYFAMVP